MPDSPLAARLGGGVDSGARSFSSSHNPAVFSSSSAGGRGDVDMAGRKPTGVDAHGNPTYFDRINKLSERLQGLQVGLQHERNSRYDQLCSRLKAVDERVTSTNDGNGKKFGMIKEQVGTLQRQVDDERVARESLSELKGRELDQLDAKLSDALETEQAARRDAETRLKSFFEEKTAFLKDDILKEGKLREESEAHLRRYLEIDIPKLYETLRDEVTQRESLEKNILKKCNEEIVKLSSSLEVEKRAREETEEAMIKMVEDVVTKLQGEIAQERRDREATEETLLKLLEDTCVKLNQASQSL